MYPSSLECLIKFRINICPPHLYTVATLPWEIQKSYFSTVLLGRVALGAQRPIAVKLARGQSVGLSVRTYVHRSVGRYVGLSSVLWKNGGSDPDAVWHRRSDGFRDEAGLGIGPREGVLLGANLGRAIVQRAYMATNRISFSIFLCLLTVNFI